MLTDSHYVSYNLQTGVEAISESAPNLGEFMAEVTGSGEWSEDGALGVPLNFNALSLVSNPANSPYRRTVKMFFTQGATRYVCSGSLIDPRAVITAGHCVHQGSGGNWSTDVIVTPAYENGSGPFGDAAGIDLGAWTGWTVSGDLDHDVGIVILDRPIGAITGWHGYGYHNTCSHFTTTTWTHDGYPAASPFNGQTMYTQSGDFDGCEYSGGSWWGNEVFFYRRSYGGQSGSGAYKSQVVWAVLSNGTNTTTWDVRITSAKFTDIKDIAIAGITPSTFDLIPLYVQTTPASIVPGNQLSSMTFLVHNYASVSHSGSVNFTMYLSPNDNITTGDVNLGSASFVYNFAPKSTALVTLTTKPTIPVSTPSGNYWIGVILNITDDDTSNNDTDGQDASPITVLSLPPPPVPTNVQATDGVYTDRVAVSWNSSAGATYYEVYRATSAAGAKTLLGSPSGTSWDDTSAAPGKNYYYWVKACHGTGCSGFSAYDTGWRAGLPPTNVQATDGTYTNKVHVSWDAVGYATGYEVYRSASVAGAKTLIGSPGTNSFDDNAVIVDMRYYYWVKACNTLGCSDFSAYNSGYAGLPAPVLVSPPDLSVTKDLKPTFMWNASTGGVEYQLQVDDDPGFGSPLIDITTMNTQHTPTSALADGVYYWHVRAGNGSGSWSLYTDPWSVTVDSYKVYLPIIIRP